MSPAALAACGESENIKPQPQPQPQPQLQTDERTEQALAAMPSMGRVLGPASTATPHPSGLYFAMIFPLRTMSFGHIVW